MLILTEPVIHRNYLNIKSICKRIFKFIKGKTFNKSSVWRGIRVSGHYGVTRSLLNGLQINGIDYVYNPINLNKNVYHNNAVILSGLDTLKSAIELKKSGRIKNIFAGPNVVVYANEIPLEMHKYIDFLIVPSNFIKELYLEDMGEEWSNKIIIWPAGVDPDWWSANRLNKDTNKILIYSKQVKGATDDVEKYIQFIKSKGFKTELIEYGNYKLDNFRNLLTQVEIMVGFVRDESQGLAWAEAWASDVYTLIWKNETQSLKGRIYKCETAPYLSNENGMYFDNIKDFENRFNSFIAESKKVSPRIFVEKSMTDEVCAKHLVKLIEQFET